jgi:hypothetical protein
MEAFIQRHILGLRTTPNTPLPRPATCLMVDRLARRSVAAQAGVAEKDLLTQIDGQPAIAFMPNLYSYRATERTYLFYSRPRHELVELRTTGIEIGVGLGKTIDAIKVLYDPRKPDFKALERVWEARDFRSLEKLASATLAASKDRGTPALVFEGAALCETGRVGDGLQRVKEYMVEYASWWTTNYAAAGLFYFGAEAHRKGDAERGQGLLSEAFEMHPSDALARAIQRVTGVLPFKPQPRWLQRRFPGDYTLPLLEGGPGEVSLRATLQAMPREKLLIVCLLANYRGNGPYGDFMERYQNYARYFSEFLHALHVLTMEKERKADRPFYYRAEDDARAAGHPVSVLLDPGDVTGAVAPQGSPFVLVLDRTGTVVYEGELESPDLWDTLASVAAP